MKQMLRIAMVCSGLLGGLHTGTVRAQDAAAPDAAPAAPAVAAPAACVGCRRRGRFLWARGGDAGFAFRRR